MPRRERRVSSTSTVIWRDFVTCGHTVYDITKMRWLGMAGDIGMFVRRMEYSGEDGWAFSDSACTCPSIKRQQQQRLGRRAARFEADVGACGFDGCRLHVGLLGAVREEEGDECRRGAQMDGLTGWRGITSKLAGDDDDAAAAGREEG
nr:hypothetical protein CFP56_00746 [Quercus suber]